YMQWEYSMRNNTKTATFVFSAQAANHLLSLGHLKVGLARCEIEKRYVVRRCQRCWSYSHDSTKCDGPDRTRNCLNCGKHGHAMKACAGEEFCAVCNKAHRHGSAKCPAFQEALQRARKADQ
uniref:Uncharacterized protein LOC114348558 n=1 Tax=Diabrotica virgifera virgifera TaxID=50390 RepID=A0A6P7GZW6_DIAVI